MRSACLAAPAALLALRPAGTLDTQSTGPRAFTLDDFARNAEVADPPVVSNGVASTLVVYPGQFHGIVLPSHARDRLGRHVRWFGEHLEGTLAPASATAAK